MDEQLLIDALTPTIEKYISIAITTEDVRSDMMCSLIEDVKTKFKLRYSEICISDRSNVSTETRGFHFRIYIRNMSFDIMYRENKVIEIIKRSNGEPIL